MKGNKVSHSTTLFVILQIMFPLKIENGQEVGILCHPTEDNESVIKGVSLPNGVEDTTLVRVQCKDGKFQNLDTKKSVNIANVACTGEYNKSNKST